MQRSITGLVLLSAKSSSQKIPLTDNPLRSYCDIDQITDTSTFLPFGSSAWTDSSNFGDEAISMWNDDRDSWILEKDDDYLSVNFRSRFGGTFFTKMCISSNGPIYMGACPAESDYNPLPILPNPSDAMKWTGFAAFWSDLMQADSIYSVRNGGNIYYREVALEDNDWKSTRDLAIFLENRCDFKKLKNEFFS